MVVQTQPAIARKVAAFYRREIVRRELAVARLAANLTHPTFMLLPGDGDERVNITEQRHAEAVAALADARRRLAYWTQLAEEVA